MRTGRFELGESALIDLGREIAGNLAPGGRVYLIGDLGSGKTTLARAIIRTLGVEGAIPSPSFILDAVYVLPSMEIHHMDLYRLSGTSVELSMLGFDEILDSQAVVIVEWADRLADLPRLPGIHVSLRCIDDPSVREVEIARHLARD